MFASLPLPARHCGAPTHLCDFVRTDDPGYLGGTRVQHMPKAQSKAQPKAQLKQGSAVKKVRICCCFHARRLPLPPSQLLLLLLLLLLLHRAHILLSIALTFFEAYHGFLLCVCVALRGRGRRSALAPRAIIECGDHVLGDIQYTVYN